MIDTLFAIFFGTPVVLAFFTPMFIPASDLLSLSPNSGDSSTVSPTNAVAQWSLRSSGDLFRTNINNTIADAGDWVLPKSNAANYEVRSTLLTGTFTADPSAGAWVALTSNRTWTRNQTVIGTSTVTATIDVRRVGSGITAITTTLTLSATMDP